MADAVVSVVAERIISLIEEQARYHVNLVKGARKEVRSLAKELRTVRNVLDDAENRRFKENSVKDWLVRLEQTSYGMEDVLDEWNYAIVKLRMEGDKSEGAVVGPPKQKVWSFIPSTSCLCFKEVVVRHDIAKKIQNVKAQLDDVLKERDRYNFVMSQPTADHPMPDSWRVQSTSLIDLENIHGRDRDRDILVSKVMGSGGGHEESGIRVVSVVGVGGLGKTTLAQLVYNDSRVEKSFDLRIWVCVSDPFEVALIAKGIIESVGKKGSLDTTQLNVLLKYVKESISGKRFLLVLDDVWTEDYNKWEPLENSLTCGGAGSMILVTTRNERVAKIMGTMDDDIHRPGVLSHEDCWLLLRRVALSRTNNLEFEDIGKKIAEKCNGLPLAAKTLGSLLRLKNTLEEWENVLNSEIWQLEKAEIDLFPHLLLSYNELSPSLKRCFSYCAVFPKDYKIQVEDLIGFWMALGYLGSEGDMEGRGREYFDILATRSLFQDFEEDGLDGKIINCKMHDIVHDFARFLRKSGRAEVTTCPTCDPLLVSTVSEYSSLVRGFEKHPPNLCNCLTRLRVLGLEGPRLRSLPQGMENLIHLRWLNLKAVGDTSPEDLKIIFQLYNLQTLRLSDLYLEEIPRELGNLIHLRQLVLSRIEFLEKLPKEIGNLIQLRHLDLRGNMSLGELPGEIGNLVHLRHLNLSGNGRLEKLPKEIGNLIHLRHLDLNLSDLKELPLEIGNLTELRHLDLWGNKSLKELPESIGSLRELRTLDVFRCDSLCRIPEGLAQLTRLRTLKEFRGGSGRSKFRLLKHLNHLTGNLRLFIRLDGLEEVVEDASEAELRNKVHIEELRIVFEDEINETEPASLSSSYSSVWMDVIDALEPHPKLRKLDISSYHGSELPPGWMVSPLNQVREVGIRYSHYLTSLPPFGKLPCLELIEFFDMEGLEFVGREFLGIAGDVGIGFPKLKKMRFWGCRKWKEWVDITAEQEDSAAVSAMPCLTHLEINSCNKLEALPHRLLRKAASLQVLNIYGSIRLEIRYRFLDDPDWISISQINPSLQLKL